MLANRWLLPSRRLHPAPMRRRAGIRNRGAGASGLALRDQSWSWTGRTVTPFWSAVPVRWVTLLTAPNGHSAHLVCVADAVSGGRRPLAAIFPGKAGTSGSTGTSPPPSVPVLANGGQAAGLLGLSAGLRLGW